MSNLTIVGIGPGGREHMTLRAISAIQEADVIVGYAPYFAYLEELADGKEHIATGMKEEMDRCRKAVASAKAGKKTVVISTGDAGVYGMAGPVMELALHDGIVPEVVPGIPAANVAAARVGAPLMHDYATISLSDLLTPWDRILKRVRCAMEADFCIALYNPRSKGRPEHLEEVVALLLEQKSPDTPVAIVKNAGRSGEVCTLCTLGTVPYERVDMLCIVLIGNSNSYVAEGRFVTPRGYEIR